MEHPRKLSSVAAILLLLLLVAVAEMGTVMVQAKECESRCKDYKGECKDDKCAEKCKMEGYNDGKCKIVDHRWNRSCVCTKKCPTTAVV
ncbi:hypothetical protein E2562_019826 [Oryza meyeriana var. granulata]|uniref:Knottins-like domain-containing protein n=1 Tax=Oryza meyeriana var. granulata TaxID=110450 RepID=A0A6G1DLS2_9ORYZ|nr:hypothetical protein E2562_019826 [Oryza meyeriana var. granulata]